MRLSIIFTIVGIAFGTMFVMINAGALPEPWPVVLRAAGILAAATALWLALRRDPVEAPTPDQQSIRAYWTAAIAEAIAIPLGAIALNTIFDRPELVVLWVVFVVGAHFLPARSFGIPGITLLGVALIALAILGTIGTLAIDDTVAPLTAVVTGFVMLAFSAKGGFTRQPHASSL